MDMTDAKEDVLAMDPEHQIDTEPPSDDILWDDVAAAAGKGPPHLEGGFKFSITGKKVTKAGPHAATVTGVTAATVTGKPPQGCRSKWSRPWGLKPKKTIPASERVAAPTEKFIRTPEGKAACKAHLEKSMTPTFYTCKFPVGEKEMCGWPGHKNLNHAMKHVASHLMENSHHVSLAWGKNKCKGKGNVPSD
jgi:hypothetical protein